MISPGSPAEIVSFVLRASLVFICAKLAFFWFRTRYWSLAPLPPGPPPRFFSGNLHQLPAYKPWLTYASWSKVYGPIVYYRIYNQDTIVLSSAKAVIDLLEAKSSSYSDRPTSVIFGNLAGRDKTVFLSSFQDSRFKTYRRMLHGGLDRRAAHSYRPIQVHETHALLNNLIARPKDFISHIRRNAAAVIMKITYGYTLEGDNDKFIALIEEGFPYMRSLRIPGKYMAEIIPILRFIPDWFPGAGFKREAKKAGNILSHIDSLPFNWAKKNIAGGNYVESFVSKHLLSETGQVADYDKQDIIKWCSSALYIGGADTTVSALTTFFMVMQLYPEIQERAQAEIDSIVQGRLPSIDDQDRMPYISAIIKEILRWGPVAPTGIAHKVIVEDVYEGFRIPQAKGATVIANIWALTHDETIYPEPMVFRPERFLGEKAEMDPFKFVFGFGRRLCPGAHLAEILLFLNISNILAVFNIRKPVDEQGREVEPQVEWMTGVTSHLKPFSCRIEPRSNDVLQLLNQ